ncbi:MAG: energy-dependent translational throttle protein EttA, partial [Sulfuritalea sp.]|nr:energy-dependent translational throttle protein EttA [Sulfuritalea sp.]
WKGNYSSWLEQKGARLETENKQMDAHAKAMKQELEWVRQNPKGRQAKSKARIARFEELNSQEHQKRNETQEIFIPVGERLGNEVIEFNNVSKAYGDRLLIDNLSFKVPPGAIVGIIGPNGAGKSTLFRMITGKEQPDSGTVVAVTHDRYFLDNAAEWILELDRGHGIPWKGNYSNWLEQKEARLETEAKQEDAHMKAMKQELAWVRSNPKARQAKSKARLARFNEMSETDYQKRNETHELFIPVAERLGDKVIEFHDVSKGFGDRLLIDKLSFTVPPGAIVGIIGPNGAGKSTLFKMLTGQDKPDSGSVVVGPTVKISYVDQSRDCLDGSKTVFEELADGADIITIGKLEIGSRAYIGRFNFKGGDQQKNVGNLSGGERGRLHLAKTLMTGGNLLLLDEPSNDLDVETLRALEDALLEFAGCAMIISHDRWFLDRICTHILACEGDSQWSFFAGNYHEYEEDKKKRLGEEGAKPKRIRYKPITR